MARASGIHQRTLGLDLLLQRTACGQCVGHFAECGGLFVLRDLHVLLHLGEIQIRDVGAAGEDRQADPRGEARESLANRPESSVLAVPKLPVRLTLGKNAARATSMLALAVRRLCSADRMSGRRSSRSDGSPSTPQRANGKGQLTGHQMPLHKRRGYVVYYLPSAAINCR